MLAITSIVVTFATINVQYSLAIAPTRSFSTEAQSVESISDAAILTRKSMPNSFEEKERCMRYATLLNMDRASWNKFRIVENAFEPSAHISSLYQKLDFTKLRNQFMKAIEDFEQRNITDKAWIELIECLRSGFGKLDAKAKKFLFEPTRTKSMKQYDSIVSMPYSWLISRNKPHPELRGDQLTNQMKQFALELVDNNETQLNLMFPKSRLFLPNDSGSETFPGLEREDSPSVPLTYMKPPPLARRVPQEAETKREKKNDQVHHKKQSMRPEDRPVAIDIVQSEQQRPVVYAKAAYMTPPNRGQQIDNGIQEQREIDILGVLAAGAHLLYKNFRPEAELGDRCDHYGRLFMTMPSHLSLDLIDELAEEGSHIVSNDQQQQSASRLLSDKQVRDRFMEVLGAFEKEEVDDYAWVELISCLREWTNIDTDVKQYLGETETANYRLNTDAKPFPQPEEQTKQFEIPQMNIINNDYPIDTKKTQEIGPSDEGIEADAAEQARAKSVVKDMVQRYEKQFNSYASKPASKVRRKRDVRMHPYM